MFTISLGKLALTIAVVLVVWYGYRWLVRAQARRRLAEERRRGLGEPAPMGWAQETAAVQDMKRCAVCGDYVVPGAARRCARSGCPFAP